MSLTDWLDSGHIVRQPTSPGEIADILATVDRDLSDALVTEISTDRRFMAAYGAGLGLASLLLRAEGYRTSSRSPGHHWRTIASVTDILGTDQQARVDLLDACRTKRNRGAYDHTGIATDGEVDDLITEVNALRQDVLTWLAARHPELSTAPRTP